jgi:hypothetical protein
MAVLIEANSVIVRAEAILSAFQGGWESFKAKVPNQTMCADGELVRVGFMTPQDLEAFVKLLQHAGLTYLKDGHAVDIVVADQFQGLTAPCSWAQFGRVNMGGDTSRKVAACRLTGSTSNQVVTPPGWTYESSLSNTYGFIPSEQVSKGLKYLRHENGVDVYISSLTGKEVFIGRTGEA